MVSRMARTLGAVIALTLLLIQHLVAGLDAQDASNRSAAAFPSIVRLNESDYSQIIGAEDRAYTVVALFTAPLNKYSCPVCKKLEDELLRVAAGLPVDIRDNVQFVSFDFDTSRPLFDKFEVRSIPLLHGYPAGASAANYVIYDAHRYGADARSVAKWLTGVLGRKVEVPEAPNAVPRWALGAGLLINGLTLLVLMPADFDIVGWRARCGSTAREYLMYAAMVLALVFTGGFMWNYIRGAGFLVRTNNGLSPFAPGLRQQTLLESIVIMGLNAVIAGCMILLICGPSPRVADFGPVNVRVGIGLAVALVAFSLEVGLFRLTKLSTYPYGVLF